MAIYGYAVFDGCNKYWLELNSGSGWVELIHEATVYDKFEAEEISKRVGGWPIPLVDRATRW